MATTRSKPSSPNAAAGAVGFALFEEVEIRKADLEDVFMQVMHDPLVVEGLA